MAHDPNCLFCKIIDGKSYQCARNDPNQANRDAIAKACLSLKKAG